MPENKKKSGTASNTSSKKNTSADTRKSGATVKNESASSHRSASSSQNSRTKASQSTTAQRKTAPKTGTTKQTATKPTQTKKTSSAPSTKKSNTGTKRASDAAEKRQSTRRSSTPKKNETSRKSAPRKSKSRSRAKLLNILPYVLMILAFIGVMVVLSLTVFFKVENLKVKIDGDMPYESEEIITVCPVKTGQNIFSETIAEAGAIVEETLPYIEHCTAERKMPDTVVLSIVGAKPAGLLTLSDGSRLILSSTGKILEMLSPVDMSASDIASQVPVSATDTSNSDISATDEPTGGFMLNDGTVLLNHSRFIDETELAVIEGLNVTGGSVGHLVETDDETAYTTLETIISLLEKHELTATGINLTSGSLYVEYEGRMNIRLGSGSQLEEKMDMAAEIIKNRLTKYDSGQIDVSNPQKAYYTPKYITG